MVFLNSCVLGFGFLGAMAYVLFSKDVDDLFEDSLSSNQLEVYQYVQQERLRLYFEGLILGNLVALAFILLYRYNMTPLIGGCLLSIVSMAITFLYYILSPKTVNMVEYLTSEEQLILWNQVEIDMRTRYLSGFALGVIGYFLLGFGFNIVNDFYGPKVVEITVREIGQPQEAKSEAKSDFFFDEEEEAEPEKPVEEESSLSTKFSDAIEKLKQQQEPVAEELSKKFKDFVKKSSEKISELPVKEKISSAFDKLKSFAKSKTSGPEAKTIVAGKLAEAETPVETEAETPVDTEVPETTVETPPETEVETPPETEFETPPETEVPEVEGPDVESPEVESPEGPNVESPDVEMESPETGDLETKTVKI